MRTVGLILVALITLTGGGAAADSQAALGPDTGHLWIVPGTEWAALVVTSADNRYKGELYLWHREPYFYEGYYRHVPLEHPVCVHGISWSPDGNAIAFYEEVDGQYRLCYLRPAGTVHKVAKHGVSCWGSKDWSPDSRYLAFVQHTESGDHVKCFPEHMAMKPALPDEWGGELFDLPAPERRAIYGLRWASDSSKLLAAAHVVQPGEEGDEPRASAPTLFLTHPGGESPKIIWQDQELEDYAPRAEWAAGGDLVVFSLAYSRACGRPGPMYVMKPDGSGLRTLWQDYEVMDFVLSPDGRQALLWILEAYHHHNHPEPNRMAAVNIIEGTTKLFKKGMLALEPNARSDGVTQSIEWAKDGSSVSFLVTTSPHPREWHRVTLELP